MNPLIRRWWLFSALRPGSAARGVDRLQVWAVILASALVVCAVPASIAVAHAVESAESHAITAEAATKRAVKAPAPAGRTDADADGRNTFVRLRGGAAGQEGTATATDPTRVARHPMIWVDPTGKPTSPPRTEIDARTSGIAAGLMLWLSVATAAGAGVAGLGRILDRRRFRAWEHDLRVLVNGGGGWTAHNP